MVAEKAKDGLECERDKRPSSKGAGGIFGRERERLLPCVTHLLPRRAEWVSSSYRISMAALGAGRGEVQMEERTFIKCVPHRPQRHSGRKNAQLAFQI